MLRCQREFFFPCFFSRCDEELLILLIRFVILFIITVLSEREMGNSFNLIVWFIFQVLCFIVFESRDIISQRCFFFLICVLLSECRLQDYRWSTDYRFLNRLSTFSDETRTVVNGIFLAVVIQKDLGGNERFNCAMYLNMLSLHKCSCCALNLKPKASVNSNFRFYTTFYFYARVKHLLNMSRF